jgi:long-chain acyl-CoA synthetase
MQRFHTLVDLLDDFRERENQPAILFVREQDLEAWTYGKLASRAHEVAIELLKLGIVRQEPVAILLPNRPEWIAVYLGIVASGGAAVPIDFLSKNEDVIRMLNRVGCRKVFTTPERQHQLQGARQQIHLAFFSPQMGTLVAAPADRRGAGDGVVLPEVRAMDRASLLFTSGTTGEPKIVPLSHANFVANVRALQEERIVGSKDRVLLPLPLHHTYPFTVGMLGTLASGATLVMPAGATGPQIFGAARATNADVLIGVPGLYESMLSAIDARLARGEKWLALVFKTLEACSIRLRRKFGLRVGRILFRWIHAQFGRSLRVLASGGAKLDPQAAWRLEGLGWNFLSGYGLTETSPMLTFNPPNRARPDGEGVPVPGVELRFEAVPGETYGEILARGPNVFSGYSDNPAANEAAFAKGGWFRTGDLGYVDDIGYLHVVGRANETIVLPDGKKVFPDNVEAAFRDTPFIRELAVLLRGQSLVALVVFDPELVRARGAARLEALLREEIERCSAHLKPFERVNGYAITDEALPRTNLGKLRRHKLPGVYERAKTGRRSAAPAPVSDADRAMLETETGRAAWEWIGSRFGGRQLTLETSPQLDLGVDSLKWIDLTMEIQDRFHVGLTEVDIARVVTLRDLIVTIVKAEGVESIAGSPAAKSTEHAKQVEPPGFLYRALGAVLYVLNKFILRLMFHLEVHGAPGLPSAGSFIITPNHASNLDPLIIAALFSWRDLRRTYWAGWTGILFAGPVMRAISRACQVLPVDPDRDPGKALALAISVVRQGNRLVWFPEGRRSPTGEITSFLPGIGRLVRETGIPAIPVRIRGAFEAMPRTRWLPRPGRISVVFGRPITAAELAGQGSPGDSNADIANALRAAVLALPEI